MFDFENDLSYHDAIRFTHPNARSLIIRFHLPEEDSMNYELYAYECRKYEEGYIRRKNKVLFELTKRESNLTYLYHYLACKVKYL